MTARKLPTISSQSGFSLVELLIALVIATLAMTAILIANQGQSQSYNTQLQIASARQKARSAIAMLRADLLMANQFNTAGQALISFVRNDGVNVRYQWSINDANGNGMAPELLRQQNTDAPQVFAEGIDGIEFLYNFANAPPVNQIAAGNPQLNDIVSVTISLVSRADGRDPHFRDSDTYRTASGQPWEQTGITDGANINNAPLNDNFHRRFWRETVTCRNIVQ